MNHWVQRYAPPAIVIVAAVYCGWPPRRPLDLGDDIVRATSVRWRPQDLSPPPPVESSRDPFAETAVEAEQSEVAVEDVEPAAPAGPDAETLRAGLHLEGIASLGGHTWAVVNGRPHLEGDFVRTNDANQYECQIIAVAAEYITVRYEDLTVDVRPGGSKRKVNSSQSPGANRSGTSPDEGSEQGADNLAPHQRRPRRRPPGGRS